MASARRKLGLMVSTAPDHPNLETALGLSKAALDGGGDVYLYLIDDAVAAVEDARLLALADRGLKLFVCAYGCQKRRRPLSDRATNCGLVVLTDVINGTDRFLSLN
jgi:sulfur relay (sulfurtransferase) complex TusBCD TusD component (DsrE family)